MFASASIITIVVTVIVVAVHRLKWPPKRHGDAAAPARIRRYGFWERAAHLITMISFLGLAATGFGASILAGGLTGWTLMLHMVAAGAFMLGLTLTTVLWAEDACFKRHDAAWLREGGRLFGHAGELPAGRFDGLQKLFFWITLLAGLVTIAAILATMLPVFGTHGQEILYDVHRYGGLALVVAMILHAYATLLAKPGAWRAMSTGRVNPDWARYHHLLWWAETNQTEDQTHDQ